jgi:hypothetical protein
MMLTLNSWSVVMSEESQAKNKKKKADDQKENSNASGGYQTPIEAGIRQTGVAAEGDAKSTAKPEAPENDSVAGSPNQGTESR